MQVYKSGTRLATGKEAEDSRRNGKLFCFKVHPNWNSTSLATANPDSTSRNTLYIDSMYASYLPTDRPNDRTLQEEQAMKMLLKKYVSILQEYDPLSIPVAWSYGTSLTNRPSVRSMPAEPRHG